MGSYQWLKILFDDLVTWLGRTFSAWIQKILTTIQSYWEEKIAPAIQYVFGSTKVLYAIFYQTIDNIVHMEIWDPKSLQYGKKSQIVAVGRAPAGVPIPTADQRNTAPILELHNAVPA